VTVPSDSLAERYGAPPRWRRNVLLGLVVLVVGVLGVLWAWITVVQSDPPVSSELIKHEIVDDHSATAVVRVQLDEDAEDVVCTVRAIAADKAVVGQQTFVPTGTGDHDVEVATERRATTVENIGCTADGQRRPR
jgi:cytoskeletal protein RodZ